MATSMLLSFILMFMPSLVDALHPSANIGWKPNSKRNGLPPTPLWRRNIPPEGYYDPGASGGSMLTQVNGTFPPGQGEPLNVILSAVSDSAVLIDSAENGGMRNYFLSFGFSSECLGQHDSTDQSANLGDGNGYKIEAAVIRWNYGDPTLGACKETIEGGNHFRYWPQDGPSGNSQAVFMAVSYELPIAKEHDIIDNGYNLGRDWLIGNATAQSTVLNTSALTNTSTFSGKTSSGGYTYQTNVKYVSGLLSNTSIGINHNITVGVDGINAIDGLVAVLGVTIVERPSTSSSSATWTALLTRAWRLPVAFSLVSLLLIPHVFL